MKTIKQLNAHYNSYGYSIERSDRTANIYIMFDGVSVWTYAGLIKELVKVMAEMPWLSHETSDLPVQSSHEQTELTASNEPYSTALISISSAIDELNKAYMHTAYRVCHSFGLTYVMFEGRIVATLGGTTADAIKEAVTRVIKNETRYTPPTYISHDDAAALGFEFIHNYNGVTVICPNGLRFKAMTKPEALQAITDGSYMTGQQGKYHTPVDLHESPINESGNTEIVISAKVRTYVTSLEAEGMGYILTFNRGGVKVKTPDGLESQLPSKTTALRWIAAGANAGADILKGRDYNPGEVCFI